MPRPPAAQICGCWGSGIVDGVDYLTYLDSSFDASIYPSIPAIKNAFRAADFVGISAYIPTGSPQYAGCAAAGGR